MVPHDENRFPGSENPLLPIPDVLAEAHDSGYEPLTVTA
jgi:hypothetical protein